LGIIINNFGSLFGKILTIHKLANPNYNKMVQKKIFLHIFFLLILFTGFSNPVIVVQAAQSQTVQQDSGVTAYDLIIAMNTLRVSYGHSALVEDPIIDAVAQSTAEIMAANSMSWHIGDVAGRLAAAGYGGGGRVVATENFAAATDFSIDQIMVVWSDPDHMIPAVNGALCNIGAGVAKSPNGLTYYVLQAAYSGGKTCGSYTSGGQLNSSQNNTTTGGNFTGVSQIIKPVKIATPGADGKTYHVVEAGQSFWSIAIAYQITIHDIEIWNNIKKESGLQLGQRLFIPNKNTAGYFTPTPVGMIQLSTPDPDGKIVHVVAMYQTLSTIAQAYGITVDTLLALNGIQVDWPLQIGQKLVVHPSNITPSPTPRPLTPLQKLTPASDGKYYHVIKSGETLSWVAKLYEITLGDLMAWNGLNASSIIQPGQKLVLQVTPPATITPTPGPPTETPTATQTVVPATLTPTQNLTETAIAQINQPEPIAIRPTSIVTWVVVIALAVGIILMVFFLKKMKK
jgi:LysM repeat protein